MTDRAPYSGSELVALVELLYRRAFMVTAYAVALVSVLAVALLPLRKSAPGTQFDSPMVLLTIALIVGAPIAARQAGPLHRLVRRRRAVELAVVALAALLISYPPRSELWWPACALLMVVATQVSPRRALVYSFAVLSANLLSHLIAGDLGQTPGVAVIGLWIGIPLWVGGTCALINRAARQLLALNIDPQVALPHAPIRKALEAGPRGAPEPPAVDDGPSLVAVLTPRQLEVLALLTDGMRYKDIAEILGISARQVQRLVADAVRRAGLGNATVLVTAATAQGVVPAGRA